MRWVAPIFVALVAAGVAQASPPQVEIRARTALALSRVRLREAGLVEVTGKLVDKLTGEGLSYQRVRVTLGGQAEWATTAADGSFVADLAGEPGQVQVELGFAGARGLDAADPLVVTTDPARAQVELSVAKLADDPAGARLAVHAMGDEGPVVVPVAIEIQHAANGPWQKLRDVQTDAPFVITRKDAGGPGQIRVRATFAGDDVRQRATAEGTLELTAGTTTSIDLKSPKLAYEDDLVVTGKVLDDDHQGVARAAVALTAGDRRLAQGATGADGAYRFDVEAQVLGECAQRPCTFGVQVQADPDGSYVRPSRSPVVQISVAAPQPVPVSYTVAAFVATVLAAGGFFAARTKPWRRFRRPAPPAEVPSHEGDAQVLHGGLVVAKPGIVSTFRRASDDGFSGVVRDTVRGRPVAHAVVRLVAGTTERETRSGSDGSFALDKLGVAEWRAEVAAPGHITEHFAVTIPHHGELRGVRIDLVPVRERVFQLYRRAAEPVLPEPRLWGIWSPRQIVDHVRSRRPSPALAELTDFVEEIYFSPRLAAETVLSHASERVDRAIQERARR